MSYSFRLPEEEPACECRWDEIRQRVDRDDCHFHFDLPEEQAEMEAGAQQIDTATLPVNRDVGSGEAEERPKRKPPHGVERQAEAG